MTDVKLVVLDMAGTTVKDENEVEKCFLAACEQTGLRVGRERINSMMGWSKREVFEILWAEQDLDVLEQKVKVDASYDAFRNVLENHYRNAIVLPTDGCLNLFKTLKENGIKIALTTGFYRVVTDIILDKLEWNKGLNAEYMGGDMIDISIASDEVEAGRPQPYMIQKAMVKLGIEDAKQVINIGDTPSDIASGIAADCLYSFGVTNGTHTEEELAALPNDGLLPNVGIAANYIDL